MLGSRFFKLALSLGALLGCVFAADSAVRRFQAAMHRFQANEGFIRALSEKSPKKIAALLRSGADPNGRTQEGATPLLVSAGLLGSVPPTTQLLDAGARVNGSGRWYGVGFIRCPVGEKQFEQTPLALAAASGQTAVVRLLLARGADPNARDGSGYTVLRRAVPKPVLVRLLLNAGARLGNDAAGHHAILAEAAGDGESETVALLLDHGADPNAATDRGNTALRGAAWRGRADIAAMLLNRGARTEAQGARFEAPLLTAASQSHAEVVRLLLAHGAKITARNEAGLTALQLAQYGLFGPYPQPQKAAGYRETIRLLNEAGLR